MFEVSHLSSQVAYEAARRGQYKLPVKCKIIAKTTELSPTKQAKE